MSSALFAAPLRRVAVAMLALLLVVILAPPRPASAALTGQISGTVRDDASGKPLPGVAVTARSPSGVYQATTDAKGQFTMIGVTPDTYTVAYELAGYEALAVQGLTVLSDSTARSAIIS